jgi:hypothetical protein
MTSTSQLLVGMKVSIGALKSKWLKLNYNRGYNVKIVQSIEKPKIQYFSVCYSTLKTDWKNVTLRYRAHVKAIGEEKDQMSIVSIDLNHTCCREDNNKKK